MYEAKVSKFVDVVFAVLYVLVVVVAIFSLINADSGQSGTTILGVFIICLFLFFVQKIVKGVLCTCARAMAIGATPHPSNTVNASTVRIACEACCELIVAKSKNCRFCGEVNTFMDGGQ